MARYLLKRILFFIPVLCTISVINFALYSAAPGDPVSVMYQQFCDGGRRSKVDGGSAGRHPPQAWFGSTLARALRGLVGHVLHGELGRSLISQRMSRRSFSMR